MPSTILSDNGVTSGTAGIKTTGSNDGQLALQTTTAGGTATTAITIDTSQNVGVGVTPSAWKSDYKAIQFSNSGAVFGTTGEALVGANVFVNSSDDNKYITTDEASMYRQANGNHIFYSAASGTAGNTITFTSVLSVNRNTTLVLQGGTSTSGTGIAFPATQSASSDANTLDDYEEGTWTPATSAANYTISSSSGSYTKIGRMVYCRFTINFSAVNASSNSDCNISGYPFTSAAVGIGNGRDNSTTGAIYVARIDNAATSGGINSYSNIANGSASVFATGRNYEFTLIYQV